MIHIDMRKKLCKIYGRADIISYEMNQAMESMIRVNAQAGNMSLEESAKGVFEKMWHNMERSLGLSGKESDNDT